MSYESQALLSQDADFVNRTAAAAAVEVADLDPDLGALGWAARHVWFIAAAPGFADDYASALAAEVERPGNDQAVISDDELRAALQAHLAGP
jgi:hypothetical protein